MNAKDQYTFQQVIDTFRKLGVPEGPTYITEHKWLYEQARRISTTYTEAFILECGTLYGESVIAIGIGIERTKQFYSSKGIINSSKVVSVDNYSAFHENQRNASSPDEIRTRITECNLQNSVEIVESDDFEYIESLEDGSLNMAWIDSSHRQTNVSKQLDLILPKMAANSLLCGHEYNGLLTLGVLYAVEDFKRKHEKHLCGFGIQDRIWWTVVREPYWRMT